MAISFSFDSLKNYFALNDNFVNIFDAGLMGGIKL
jgi:hypothetical protein